MRKKKVATVGTRQHVPWQTNALRPTWFTKLLWNTRTKLNTTLGWRRTPSKPAIRCTSLHSNTARIEIRQSCQIWFGRSPTRELTTISPGKSSTKLDPTRPKNVLAIYAFPRNSTSWLDPTLSIGRPSCSISALIAENFWRETTSLVNRWHHLHVIDTWHQQTHVCLRICVWMYI